MAENPTSLLTVQGDDLDLPITIESSGTPIDLTGATIQSQLRKEYGQPVAATFTVAETDLANGQFTLSLSAAETAALPTVAKGKIASFVWDVEVLDIGGTKTTYIYGYIKVKPEVTT